MSREVWKKIPEWEGLYEVSNKGRVRSLSREVAGKYGSKRCIRGRILKPYKDGRGRYLMVDLWVANTRKKCLVHRLVLCAFISACPDGMEVLHGKGGIDNNDISNLKYGTRSENLMDCYRDGTVPSARAVKRSDGLIFQSLREAARYTNAHISSLVLVCQDKRKTTAGFGWEYI